MHYHLLLLLHVGSDEVAIRGPRAVKRDFRAIGWLFKESRVQAVFSVLPVAGNDEGRASRSITVSVTGITSKILGL